MDERPRPDIEHTREALREHAEEPLEDEESGSGEEESGTDDSDEE